LRIALSFCAAFCPAPIAMFAGYAVVMRPAIHARSPAAADMMSWDLAALLALLTVLAAVAGWIVAGRITASLAALAERAQGFARADFKTEVPCTDEAGLIGEIARPLAIFRRDGDSYLESQKEKGRLDAEAKAQREAAEEERRQHQERMAALAAGQAQVVRALAEGLERVAQGDLAWRITGELDEGYQKLSEDFHAAMEQLQSVMKVIVQNAQTIRSGAEEISKSSDDLSRRTEQQAASLEETAAALDEITATVRKTADGANHASTVVASAKAEAELSGQVTRDAIVAMGEIEGSARQISQIIGVIDEIAFQTNLLALNAGVEAARAGDAGRGFAVVASEVRSLAQRSAEAAKEIKALISQSAMQVASGVDLVGQTGQALGRIVAKVGEIDTVVGEIATAAKEQSVALNEVNSALNQMDQVTQQNAAMVEQSTAASHELASEADELSRMVGRFRLDHEPAAPPEREPPAPAPHATPRLRPPAPVRSGPVPRTALARKIEPALDDGWEEF
jgi:methyl-accepting chemotaxis protein